MSGLPAIRLSLAVVVSISGVGLALVPGALVGQMFRVVWPAAGCQAGFWAKPLAVIPATAAKRNKRISMMKDLEDKVSRDDSSPRACGASFGGRRKQVSEAISIVHFSRCLPWCMVFKDRPGIAMIGKLMRKVLRRRSILIFGTKL